MEIHKFEKFTNFSLICTMTKQDFTGLFVNKAMCFSDTIDFNGRSNT